jgi:hypothetical protein
MKKKPGSKGLGFKMQQKAIALGDRLQQFGKSALQTVLSIPAVVAKSVSHLAKTISNQIASFIESLQLGRIFRRMGLPFWTLLGVGFAGWWFDNAAALIESFIHYRTYALTE